VRKGQSFPPFLLRFSLLGDDRDEMSTCDFLFRGFGRLRSIRAVQQEVDEDEQASSYDFHIHFFFRARIRWPHFRPVSHGTGHVTQLFVSKMPLVVT
jgi:hypothetical protein